MILFVSGGSSELGRTLIRQVWGQYDRIVAHYCSHKEQLKALKAELEGENAPEGGKLVLAQADLACESQVKSLCSVLKEKELLPDHYVSFPAAPVRIEKFHKMKWEELENDMGLQLKSNVLMLQQFLPAMAKRKYGKAVLMLSSCTAGTPPKYWSAYTTVKYALLGLVKSLAVEYGEKGVRVNGVSPSMVGTKFVENLPHLVIEKNQMEHPLGRLARPEEVTGVIGMLLSEQGDYINGENIVISGGSVMG